MKKVLFSIGSLQVGGAETVMVDLINNIYKDFDITILLIEKKGELLKNINSNVKIKYLTKSREFCTNIIQVYYNKIKLSLIYRFLSKKKWYINKIYKKILKESYDTEIAFLAGVPADIISNSPNKKSKKIAWIHSCVNKNNFKSYHNHLTLAQKFNTIIAVSKGSLDVFKSVYPDIKGEIILIHNYVDINKIINKSNEKINSFFSKDKLNCLSLGRLSSEKGFDRIINIAKNYEDKINFYIGGMGPLKSQLEQKIDELNIKNVFLLGLLKNPYPYIKKADLFLLSSRSEAYPTVVIEAMILNKFVISTKCAGVDEILENYQNKIIVENDNNTIADGLDEYLKNKKKITENNNNFEKINNNNLELVKKIIK